MNIFVHNLNVKTLLILYDGGRFEPAQQVPLFLSEGKNSISYYLLLFDSWSTWKVDGKPPAVLIIILLYHILDKSDCEAE